MSRPTLTYPVKAEEAEAVAAGAGSPCALGGVQVRDAQGAAQNLRQPVRGARAGGRPLSSRPPFCPAWPAPQQLSAWQPSLPPHLVHKAGLGPRVLG